MDPCKFNYLVAYLSRNEYPVGLTKMDKKTLRRMSRNYTVQDGHLFYTFKDGKRKVVVGVEAARKIFHEFHSSTFGGHSGINKTQRSIGARFFWPDMTIHIKDWIKHCNACQKEQPSLKKCPELQPIKVGRAWELIGVDLMGPLPTTAAGYRYIFTATDYFSKWVEAFPLKQKNASEVSARFVELFLRHGCPKKILSDQGREFLNAVNNKLFELLNIKRAVSSAYHPQTNGLDERTNANIKSALAKYVNEHQTDWDLYLDHVLFALRSKPHSTTKFSPFLLYMGREATFPCELGNKLLQFVKPSQSDYPVILAEMKNRAAELHEQAKQNIALGQERQKIQYKKRLCKRYNPYSFKEGEFVLLQNSRRNTRKGGSLETRFSGPYSVAEIKGKRVKLINDRNKLLSRTCNLDMLRPYNASDPGKRNTDTLSSVAPSCATPLPLSPSRLPEFQMSSSPSHLSSSPARFALSPARVAPSPAALAPSAGHMLLSRAQVEVSPSRLISPPFSDSVLKKKVSDVCALSPARVAPSPAGLAPSAGHMSLSTAQVEVYPSRLLSPPFSDSVLKKKVSDVCALSPSRVAPSQAGLAPSAGHMLLSTAQVEVSPSRLISPPFSDSVVKKKVSDVWKKPQTGRLEAVVSNFKLYDSSFGTLKDKEWICDEVIDAYLSTICLIRPKCLLMSATVASCVFSGNYPSSSCRLPIFENETILCPTNTGMHWILLIVKPLAKRLLLYDSLVGDAVKYQKCLTNWRAFLQAIGSQDNEHWQLVVESNVKQQDSYNCGVFCMLFAEFYVAGFPVPQQDIINDSFLSEYRLFIAMKLMKFSDSVQDVCGECNCTSSSLQSQSSVLCHDCFRWIHLRCIKNDPSVLHPSQGFLCSKCL